MKPIIQKMIIGVNLLACLLLIGCSQSDSEVETAKKSDVANQNKTSNDSTGDKGTPAADQAAKKQAQQSKAAAQSKDAKKSKSKMGGMTGMAGMAGGKMKFPAPADMKFKDTIETNVKAPKNLGDLVFTNTDGSEIKLGEYAGKKNVILVFTEGFNGMLCPFCKTQTSRLVANYDEFKERDCEVIVVYPGPEDHLDEFVEAALKTEKSQVDKVPFPIVLDKEFAATNFFNIHSMFAHPSTYLIDKQGSVQFAYVGNDMSADRPSIKALLQRLDQLKK